MATLCRRPAKRASTTCGVRLGPSQQFGADALAAKVGRDGDEADDPLVVIDPLTAGSGAEAGQREADDGRVIQGDDQAVVLEVRLGEEEVFEDHRRHGNDGTAPREGPVPDRGESGRIGVAKRTIANHS
jgi:hypothetical protein